MTEKNSLVEDQMKRLWTFFEVYGPEVLSKEEMASMRHFIETGKPLVYSKPYIPPSSTAVYDNDSWVDSLNYQGFKSQMGTTAKIKTYTRTM